MAKRHGTRLHILHISTRDELDLFDNTLPLEQKRITAEICVHHPHFSADDYASLGNDIKCNPAIKGREHRDALLPALLDNRLDVVATDHAPHTRAEKDQSYLQAPSGLPLVQHTLNVMLGFYHAGQISLERIVEKMCHAPAVAFRIKERGFLTTMRAAGPIFPSSISTTNGRCKRKTSCIGAGRSAVRRATFQGKSIEYYRERAFGLARRPVAGRKDGGTGSFWAMIERI